MVSATQGKRAEEDVRYPIGRFRAHVRERPEKAALVWVGADGRELERYTYRRFDEASRRLANALLKEGLEYGDTVVLAYTPGPDFYLAFWACMLIGVVAVPVSPPFSRTDVKKFLKIFNNSGAKAVLTDKLFSRLVTMKIRKAKAKQLGMGIVSMFGGKTKKRLGFADLESLLWMTTSEMTTPASLENMHPQPVNDTAFIMYSSGSTSDPKGALTSFANLRHQFEMIGEALGSSPDHVCCWWAPHFHDFGLISGFLNSFYQGCESVVTSPMYFIQRPALWLDMMHQYRATHTFGPDFGFLLLVKKTTQEEREVEKWDLSPLKVAMSAAEKVRHATLERFAEAFEVCGFRRQAFCPAYGLAEHSVGVTINGAGRLPETLHLRRDALEQDGRVLLAKNPGAARSREDDERVKHLVGSGTIWHDTEVRIVELDEDNAPVRLAPVDQVGEIWVSSGSKTLGYHKLPDKTREVFHAHLPGVQAGSPEAAWEFLRTGDLGFISSENGELFVCGRNKDMIIIAGKNHYSEDMELNIAEDLGDYLRPGCIATFSMEDRQNQREMLCVVAEAKSKSIDRQACFEKIQECIAREHHIIVSRIVLLEPRTIPKTSSGKIRRYLVRQHMSDDALKVIPDGEWFNQHDDNGAAPPQPAPPRESIPPANVRQSFPHLNIPTPVTAQPAVRITDTVRASDFPKLLLDFRNFVSSHGAPATFPVYFPECGEGFEHWFYSIGTQNLAALFDESKFYRMPVWNFTSVDPSLFHQKNFPRWANGDVHRAMKKRLAEMVAERLPRTMARATQTTQRFLERWREAESFRWLPEFNEFTTALFCEVFAGKMLPEAPELFVSLLYGVDPFRKRSFESKQVTREDNVAEGLRAKAALSEFMVGKQPSEAAQFDADLLVGAGCFAVIPALKNVLINLYAILSSEPDARQRVIEELQSLEDPIRSEALASQTPFFDACIYETIRLHPPVGHYYARAKHDMTLDGVRIPKDANVVGHTWYSYRDPTLFERPNIFDPERFLPPRNEHQSRPHAFDPFGTGDPLEGHACPGQDIAMLLVKSVIAKSLLDYDWELAQPAWDDTRYRERYGVPNFEDGMFVRGFRKRTEGELDFDGPSPDALEEMTSDELRAFDGATPDTPIYIALCGVIYDMSGSRNFYGPGGSYEILAGRDASRALATMSLEPAAVDEPSVEGLSEPEQQNLKQWRERLGSKYPKVARLVVTKSTVRTRPRRRKLESPRAWRVAVVGGGASGLAAAMALSEYGYKVKVFEKRLQLGGHACNKPVGPHMRQPAFGVFMQRQWPNAYRMMREVGIKPSVECPAKDSIAHFAKDGHAIDVKSAHEEALRFYYDMARVVNDPEADGITIGQFLKDEGYSHKFICYYFLGNVIHYFAGQSLEYYLGYPLRLIAWMFLGITASEEDNILRVDNGRYMDALRMRLEERRVPILRNTSVEFLARDDEGVTLGYQGGTEEFGHVILAVQPHHALSVMGHHASEEERTLLSQFEYTSDTVVLHFDDAWVPQRREDWGLLNVCLPDEGQPLPELTDTVPITTAFTSEGDGRTPIFSTYAYALADDWPGEGPVWRYRFEHARVTPETQRLRVDLKALQGAAHVHFCGSWSRGLTLHEDAVVTGLEAANRVLGVERQVSILRAAQPQPEPFQQATAALGGDITEVVHTLSSLIGELTEIDHELDADTDLLALGLSSLDIARLVNAVNARMSSHSVSVEEFYALDTLGEVAEILLGEDAERPSQGARAAGPPLTSRVPTGLQDGASERLHPVSFAQAPILQSHFMSRQASAHWNIPMRTWLHGTVNVVALKEAVRKMAERQWVLRTRFQRIEGGGFAQRVVAELEGDWFSVEQLPSDAATVARALEISESPLDVSTEVIRVHLLQVSEDRALLALVIHHAVADGWSLGVLVRELWSAYTRLCAADADTAMRMPLLPVQFVDVAYWQEDRKKQDDYASRIAYWQAQLTTPLPTLQVAKRGARAKSGQTMARAVEFELSAARVEILRDLSRQFRTSLNTVLLTLYAYVLNRRGGHEKVIVQVPVAGRQPETEALIGCFADALLLTVSTPKGETMEAWVRETHRVLYEGLKQAVPMSLLLQELKVPPGEKLRVHRAVLHWEQTVNLRDTGTLEKGGLESRLFEAGGEEKSAIAAQSQSVLNINERADGSMHARWLFSEAAVEPSTVDALVTAFQDAVNRLDPSATALHLDAAPTKTLPPATESQEGPSMLQPFAASRIFGGE